MKLYRFTDYSLRVLFYLAINRDSRATLAEIADFFPISLEHLRKVVHELARAGYLRTYQGKSGGIELQREPADINVGEVIRRFEGQDGLIDCAGLGCRLAGFCSLSTVLEEGRQAFFATLDEYSLADLLNNNRRMVTRLSNPQRDGVPLMHPAIPAASKNNKKRQSH